MIKRMIGTWGASVREKANYFQYMVELRNQTDKTVASIDLDYDVPGFEVTKKSTHVSSQPSAIETTSVLASDEQKDYRYTLKFPSGQPFQFFLFKPLLRVTLDDGESVLRSGPLISYMPGVSTDDLPLVWQMAH